MSKVAAIALGLLMVSAPSGFRGGCRDATQSATRLAYYDIRDMRRSVAIMPQKSLLLLPDSNSVPVGGRERVEDRERLALSLVNPTPAAALESSIERGERTVARVCTPCHGAGMEGNGPVAAFFIPPPDLLGESVRARSDGFLYATIRNGGAVMPAYGAQISTAEAWDVVNFLRRRQQMSPR